MSKKPIIIIGGGNMGGAIANRWHQTKLGRIHVIEPKEERRAELAAAGLKTYATLAEAPTADMYLLAIKPQQFAAYAPALTEALAGRTPLLLSIMAGIALADLAKITPRVARIMPNLPALVGESMSVACAPALDEDTQDFISQAFFAIGDCVWVQEETQLTITTAISGSGPGYLFAFMEGLQQAAINQGIDPELARDLVRQTLLGAALLAEESEVDLATLRAQVTSPGGTTEAALNSFGAGDLNGLIDKAVKAAIARSETLAKS